MSEHTTSERAERRRTPRVKATHELVLHASGGDGISATSVDLNLGGIYCTLARYIPLFTKIQVGMSLPVADEGGQQHMYDLVLEGVVVRMEPEEPSDGCTAYACAMAFVNLEPEAELVLAKHLLQMLGEGS